MSNFAEEILDIVTWALDTNYCEMYRNYNELYKKLREIKERKYSNLTWLQYDYIHKSEQQLNFTM